MPRTFPVALLAAIALTETVTGQSSGTYPKVYGPNGQLYGPTQAHYQYQLQYGRPWHGMDGLPGGVGAGYVNGYPGAGRHYHAGSFYYPPFIYPPIYVGGGYDYYGGYDYGYGAFGYAPSWPLIAPVQPQIPPDHQAVLQEWLQDERRQWTSPLESMPVEQLPKRFVKPSTAAAKARSVRLMHTGDLQFRQLDYSAAVSDYQEALMAAQDLPEPYFRLAIAKAAISKFDDAVLHLKLGLQLDSAWPQTAPQLSELFGEHNLLPITQFKHQVVNWVKEDIRDPDRLFLLGVILHMDNDRERAAELFETAARLGGMKQYLHAFLFGPGENAQARRDDRVQKADEAAPPPPPGLDEPVNPPAAPVVTTPPAEARPADVIPPPLPE